MKKTEYKSVAITGIQIPNWSLKIKDPVKYGWLYTSINLYGQLTPIQVRELSKNNYELITGRNVLAIMKHLEYDEVCCFNHGTISEADAKRIAIETDLHSFELDSVDVAKALSELNQIYSTADLASTMPLTEHEIKCYIESLTFDWSKLKKECMERAAKKAKNKKKIVMMEPDELPESEPENSINVYKRIGLNLFNNSI